MKLHWRRGDDDETAACGARVPENRLFGRMFGGRPPGARCAKCQKAYLAAMADKGHFGFG